MGLSALQGCGSDTSRNIRPKQRAIGGSAPTHFQEVTRNRVGLRLARIVTFSEGLNAADNPLVRWSSRYQPAD
ncbi:hypothetical protein pipiens_011448 [Culex pipiens pipiens]|uniref:Uncharacterized protein n=1 Tax=Culex pipiens pipiens TaxID=38569 RepID=A0ABD1D6B2_CULPP